MVSQGTLATSWLVAMILMILLTLVAAVCCAWAMVIKMSNRLVSVTVDWRKV